jgi:hypothetical protein
MAIRHVKKPISFPPAHFYLEDVEEIVQSMAAAGEAFGETHQIGFQVGQNKVCDTIDDLKNIGGSWREFVINVSGQTVSFYPSGPLIGVFDDADTSDRILKLSLMREATARAFLRRVPLFLWIIICVGTALALSKLFMISSFWGLFGLVLMVILAGIGTWWALAQPFLELRYSHEPSPKLAGLKERGGKLVGLWREHLSVW